MEMGAFDEETLYITRKFVNLRYQFYHVIYHCFGNILKNLKPPVCYDQTDIQTHYRNGLFFGNQICPYLKPNTG
jgi:alpha-glucosidase